jgi:hypothetical protein
MRENPANSGNVRKFGQQTIVLPECLTVGRMRIACPEVSRDESSTSVKFSNCCGSG